MGDIYLSDLICCLFLLLNKFLTVVFTWSQGTCLYMLALDWWFIKELQFFYCYSFELNSLTLCLLHCLVRQSVISDTNQISRPLPFNAERTTNRETRDGEEFWVLCDCYLNADMECSVGACAAQLKSIHIMALSAFCIQCNTQMQNWV